MALTKKQEEFLQELLKGHTIKESAQNIGLSLSRAYAFNSNEEFKREYRNKRNEIMRQVSTRIQGQSVNAIDTLMEIIENKKVSPYARMQASQTILQLAYKSYENEDIHEMIEELKSDIERLQNGEK